VGRPTVKRVTKKDHSRINRARWSRPILLFNTEHHLKLTGKPGVYRVRAYKGDNPFHISRHSGVDRLGILHIGKSKNLGVRIRTFRQATEGLSAPHHGGREFYRWQFSRWVFTRNLRYDYYVTRTEKDAIKLEELLHKKYRLNFLDRPPLDGTSGSAFSRK